VEIWYGECIKLCKFTLVLLEMFYHLVECECAEETGLPFIEVTFFFKPQVHNGEAEN